MLPDHSHPLANKYVAAFTTANPEMRFRIDFRILDGFQSTTKGAD